MQASSLVSAEQLKSIQVGYPPVSMGDSSTLQVWATSLQELMPKILLQKLAAPELASEPRDIAALRDVLWKEGAPVASFPLLKMNRRRYLEAVCEHLTACEQVICCPHWRCTEII